MRHTIGISLPRLNSGISFPGKDGSRRRVVVSGVRRMNEVNPRRARLVLGWVTVFGGWGVYHLGV